MGGVPHYGNRKEEGPTSIGISGNIFFHVNLYSYDSRWFNFSITINHMILNSLTFCVALSHDSKQFVDLTGSNKCPGRVRDLSPSRWVFSYVVSVTKSEN